MFIQVINLDRSVDRMQTIAAELDRQHLKYVRLPATDGKALTAADRKLYSAHRSLLYIGRRLRDTEIACYISHVRAAEAFLTSGARLGLVLEDDANPPAEFRSILDSLTEALEGVTDWEVGNLGKTPRPRYRKRIAQLSGGYDLVRAYRFPIRCTAVLWSREGARHFVETAYPIFAAVDMKIQAQATLSGKGVATVPELVPTTGVTSDIDPSGGLRKGPSRLAAFLPTAAMRVRHSILRRAARRNMHEAGVTNGSYRPV